MANYQKTQELFNRLGQRKVVIWPASRLSCSLYLTCIRRNCLYIFSQKISQSKYTYPMYYIPNTVNLEDNQIKYLPFVITLTRGTIKNVSLLSLQLDLFLLVSYSPTTETCAGMFCHSCEINEGT